MYKYFQLDLLTLSTVFFQVLKNRANIPRTLYILLGIYIMRPLAVRPVYTIAYKRGPFQPRPLYSKIYTEVRGGGDMTPFFGAKKYKKIYNK